jgi:hypothetical protein
MQEAIIDMETVLQGIGRSRRPRLRAGRSALGALESEPVLQEFLGGAIMELAGKMALEGCPPTATRIMYRELSFLLAVTFDAVREAHRKLYADLLPPADPSAGN